MIRKCTRVRSFDRQMYTCEVTYQSLTFDYCANVHDEVQMSVRPKHADSIGKLFAQAIKEAGTCYVVGAGTSSGSHGVQ